MHLASRVVVRERGGHLTPTCVVNTDEENLGHVLHDLPSCLRHGPQPLPREPLREDRDVNLDRRIHPPQRGVMQDGFHRLRREDPGELRCEPLPSARQLDLGRDST